MSTLKVYRKTSVLLFAEMVISLLFFVISFAVIIRVFAAADGLERSTRLRQRASLCAQSIAEAYSVSGDPAEAVRLAVGAEPLNASEGRFNMTLDEQIRPAEEGTVLLSITESRSATGAGVYSELAVTFVSGGKQLCELTCGAYIPEGGAAVE